jgi:hypothetical protein
MAVASGFGLLTAILKISFFCMKDSGTDVSVAIVPSIDP